MPGMDGPEALARINERRSDLPLATVTGLDDELVARAAVEKGAAVDDRVAD